MPTHPAANAALVVAVVEHVVPPALVPPEEGVLGMVVGCVDHLDRVGDDAPRLHQVLGRGGRLRYDKRTFCQEPRQTLLTHGRETIVGSHHAQEIGAGGL